MDKLFLEDELSGVVSSYIQLTDRYMNPPKFRGISKKGRFLYKNVCVISDENALGRFMLPSFISVKNHRRLSSVCAYSVGNAAEPYEDFDYAGQLPQPIAELDDSKTFNKTAFMLCIDCDNVSARDEWLETIRRVTSIASKGKDNMCIVSLLLPEYPAIPDPEIDSLSEREFSFFMEKKIENPTEPQKFFVEIETLCREIVNSGFENINISRVDNLIGPDSCHIRVFDLLSFVDEAFETGVVKVTTEDYQTAISCSYMRDAVKFAIQILYCGRKGHIYNFCSFSTSVAKLKTTVRSCFKERLALEVESDAVEVGYRRLNTLKFFQCGFSKKKCISQNAAVYRTVCEHLGEKHNNKKNIAIYSGKLTRIKELELMMLKDIDEICNRHGIKYFLCGGTMLGAVRYGHSIPWDDDLDIGMLREDFDKFREVMLKEHNKDLYNYSSHWNKSGSHYIVDKIRLNGTFFSTRYSSVHEYPDGLFIDVLVYDQTSNNRKIGMLHSRIVQVLSYIIEVLWYNHPRKKRRKLEAIMLPFIRVFPLNFYHAIYEFVLKLFKNKKNAKYVIDSTGKLQKKGPFLKQGLEDVQRVDFDEGFQAPIPIDYTNYLTFDYGPNYLPEPTLSKRAAPHNFARIDLGGYIFNTEEGFDYRDLDVRGELFE